MGIFYKHTDRLNALAKKTGLSLATNRESDLMGALFGGRGNKYDELQYMRNANTDAQGVNNKDSDALTKFTTGKGVTNVSRADQLEREFYQEKDY